MVDVTYVRGWEDCLEAVSTMMEETESLSELKKKVRKLQGLVKQNKFEKIKYELGAFDIF
jgi:hypothetical protein